MPTALVTGASRGVGRGAAIGLSQAGFTVIATGRSIDSAHLPDSVIRIRCDHSKDSDTARVFEETSRLGHGLEVVVNSAWGGYEKMVENGQFIWPRPFWFDAESRWSSMMDAGARAAFMVSSRAAPLMIAQRSGLIVNISFWAAQKYVGNAVYGISKAATDKLSADTAHELRSHGVTVVSLYPGLVRTESVLEAAKAGWLNLSNSESPEFIGKVVAALYSDPNLIERSGKVQVAAQVAKDLGVVDIDGKQPVPLNLANV